MTDTTKKSHAVHKAAILMAAVIFIFIWLSKVVQAQAATDYLGIPGPIGFQGTDHVLVWSSQASPDYTKQEYLSQGQTPDAYTDMVLVETLATLDSPENISARMVDALDQRKATDPLVNHAILRNDAQSEVILDFLLSSQTPDGERIIEWNAYRYTELPRDVPGILLLGISRRAYGDADAQTFMQELGQMRGEAINALATMPVPQPTR